MLDPAIAETMPKKLTAHTGMDAMTHAIEAYVAALRSDFSDPLALKAIRRICQYNCSLYCPTIISNPFRCVLSS